jgi:2-amino-4-hydroxy-6-hydroxymethyldihydropteridine diphosphokinase
MHNPPAQLETAVAALRRLPTTRILRLSPVYVSKAWGKTDQPDFVNMVAEIDTNLEPPDLLKEVKHIEADQGRVPGERWGPRPVDIDILLYGDQVVNTSDLAIPHPRMWERAFVLRPLADLTPDIVAPGGVPIHKLLERPDIASQGVWPATNETTDQAPVAPATGRKLAK